MPAPSWHTGPQGAAFLDLLLFFLADKGSSPDWGCRMKPWEHCKVLAQRHRASSTPAVWCPGGARTACLLREGAVKAEECCSCWVHWQGELAICWKAISIDRRQSGERSWVYKNRRKVCVSSPWRAGWHLGQREQEEHPLRRVSTEQAGSSGLRQMRSDKTHYHATDLL